MSDLNGEQLAILIHTNRNGRFCGDSADMRVLVAKGLMTSLGKVKWCPDEYFQITQAGREAIKAAGAVTSRVS
jgi:hypothetical protein